VAATNAASGGRLGSRKRPRGAEWQVGPDEPANRRTALSERRRKTTPRDPISPEMRAYAGDSLRPKLPVEPEPKQADEHSIDRTEEPALEPQELDRAAEAPGQAEAAEPVAVEPAAPEGEPRSVELMEIAHPLPKPFHVLIVGGGGTGAALAHDLALRGLAVTVVEKGELTSGTTGRHHGLLHSGARYVTTDRPVAIECGAENKILRRIAPGSFEENDGLFVAVTDEQADFAAQFLEACWQCAVPTRRLSRNEALAMEPGLNPAVRLAIQVPDATMDAMRLPLRFFATARANGAEIRPFTEVVDIERSHAAVTGARVRDHARDREYAIQADLVVNATGPWAGHVAALAGVAVPIAPSPGVLVSVRGRHTNMVINRLAPPGDADIVVPQRGSTVLGTTSWVVDNPDRAELPRDHVERIVRATAELVPSLAAAEIRARWVAVRPLVGRGTGSGRELARDTACIDHARDRKPVEGLVTVAGGKATTLRAMARTAADTICAKLGYESRSTTDEVVLLPHSAWYAR
jgi:glycerol-3-phosphate dehydrogenase